MQVTNLSHNKRAKQTLNVFGTPEDAMRAEPCSGTACFVVKTIERNLPLAQYVKFIDGQLSFSIPGGERHYYDADEITKAQAIAFDLMFENTGDQYIPANDVKMTFHYLGSKPRNTNNDGTPKGDKGKREARNAARKSQAGTGTHKARRIAGGKSVRMTDDEWTEYLDRQKRG